MIAAAFTYLMFMTGVLAWSAVAVIAAGLMIARTTCALRAEAAADAIEQEIVGRASLLRDHRRTS